MSLEGPAGSYPRKQTLISPQGSPAIMKHLLEPATVLKALGAESLNHTTPYEMRQHHPHHCHLHLTEEEPEMPRGPGTGLPVTVSRMRLALPPDVCSKPQGNAAVPHSLPDCAVPQSLAPVHRLQDCAASAASAPGQVLACSLSSFSLVQ